MALSDEDYGILWNTVCFEELTREAKIIIIFKAWIEGDLELIPKQQLIDTAAFIILSEGRELP